MTISNRRITDPSADVIAELVAGLGPSWHGRHQARSASRPRRRAVDAGAKYRFVFVDRLLAALVHLHYGATHDVLACWSGVDRSTIIRAIGEVRPLPAGRGCTISPGVRLRTLPEVIDHLGVSGQTGIIDGTEIRVRRPATGRKVSGVPERPQPRLRPGRHHNSVRLRGRHRQGHRFPHRHRRAAESKKFLAKLDRKVPEGLDVHFILDV
ncbi:transposase family protein [Streptomyces sp. NPDC088757]|uniref:transposase family protein n=1 Tax=Streptomyces sp. NPDC088757 TaxID=3365889 RepID=UPI0038140708